MSHPRLTLNPTVINLRDLPAEGRSLVYTNEGAELTPFLQDLIATLPYRVEITIKPMGNVFEASGRIETGLNEICSLCGIDIRLPIKESFHEILLIQGPAERGSHTSRVNHSSELSLDGPECTELSSDRFEVGEFVHELIGIARPIRPLGRPDCDESCENYQKALASARLESPADKGFQKVNPFEALRGLKLNG